VQKFSRKGLVCKTWEGELAMSTIPGSAPQLFDFTVRDEAVAEQIRRIMETQDGRVAITYAQHKKIPLSCFGETEYFVQNARPVSPLPGQGSLAPGAPGAPGAPTAPGTPAPAVPAPAAPATPATPTP
jgi:hypothetical protein